MKKITHIFIFLVLILGTALGQIPMFFNTNVATGANVFPLGNTTTSRKVQWFIPPNSLGAVTAGNMITKVYFQTGSANTLTYPILTIKLKVGTGTGLTGVAAGPIEPGMVVYYTAVNQTVTSTVGGWLGFTLTTPFPYNPAQPLVVELEHNSSTAGPSIYQAVSIPGPGNGRQWADYNVANITGIGTNQVNFGIDVVPATPCSGAPLGASVVATSASVCPGSTVGLSLSNAYLFGGISYQWEMSTSGINGAYSSVANATTSALNTPTLGISTAYRAVITCSNGPVSTTATPILINVGAPAVSNAIPAIPLVCPGNAGTLSLGANYQGVTYQWQTSTLSIVGLWSNASGTTAATSGTLSTLVSPNLTTTTYYQAIITCTSNPTFTSVANAVGINIQGLTVNTVPYNEGFEGISVNNQLPNCSWAASSIANVCQTNTLAAANNRIPHAGLKFASFKSGTSASGDYFYTNGIQLSAGVTYSGAVWYTTDGALGWTNLSFMVGPNQSVVGLTTVATVTGAVSGTIYQLLSGTFSVATTGIYYPAIKCIGNATPQFLSFDDISVTIPCSINSPSLVVTVNSNTICSAHSLTLIANGADTYSWSTGAVGPVATTNPVNLGLNSYTVWGNSILTSCTNASVVSVNVIPSPVVFISATPPVVCAGQPVSLAAVGDANSFFWSNNANTAVITVTTNVATTYSVTGTGSNGCTTAAIQSVGVLPLPIVGVNGNGGDVCIGDLVSLTASGALTYMWVSNTSANLLQGSPVNVVLNGTTIFTVSGTGSNGCVGKNSFTQNAVVCVGIENYSLESGVQVYPNPTQGEVTVELNTDDVKTIEVLDLTGRIILMNSGTDKKMTANLNELVNGIYYVRIKSNAAVDVVKIVKQ